MSNKKSKSIISLPGKVIGLIQIEGDDHPYIYWSKPDAGPSASCIMEEALLQRIKSELATGDKIQIDLTRGGPGMKILDFILLEPVSSEENPERKLNLSIWGPDITRLDELLETTEIDRARGTEGKVH